MKPAFEPGDKCNEFTILERVGTAAKGRVLWRTVCSCGEVVDRDSQQIRRLGSCGCKRKNVGPAPLPGERFGAMTAVRPAGRNSHRFVLWQFRCDCGKEIVRTVSQMRKPFHHHCGCLMSELNCRVVPAKRRKATVMERIRKRLRTSPSGCIEWTGPRHKGYGQLGYVSVHRAMYEDAKGPIPAGLTIDHLCLNKICCNPEHLEPVTQSENSRRMMALRASPTCKMGHEWTPKTTRHHKGKRFCKICCARRQRELRAKVREAKHAAS